MESMGVNYLAVLVAGAAYTVLGAIWYSTALFGNTWLAGIGKTKEQADKDFSAWKILGAFVAGLISAYGIARILSWTHLEPVWGGFVIGLIASVCFAAMTTGINECMEGRSVKVFLVNAIYNTIGFVGMGLIIGVWQ